MVVIDDRTASRNWQKPNAANKLKDDVVRLRAALEAAAGDVTNLLIALALKADADHVHTIESIAGLQLALDGKSGTNHSHALGALSDVSVVGVTNSQFLMRQGAQWIPVTPQVSHVSGLQAVLDGKMSTADAAAAIAAAIQAVLGDHQVGSTADFLAKVANRLLSATAVWSAGAEVTVAYAASIALNFDSLINAKITLTGNVTLAAPTNQKAGQSGCIRLIQDATGSRTASFHANFKFAGGTPSLTTTAGATDLLYYHVVEPGIIHAALNKAIA